MLLSGRSSTAEEVVYRLQVVRRLQFLQRLHVRCLQRVNLCVCISTCRVISQVSGATLPYMFAFHRRCPCILVHTRTWMFHLISVDSSQCDILRHRIELVLQHALNNHKWMTREFNYLVTHKRCNCFIIIPTLLVTYVHNILIVIWSLYLESGCIG